MPAAFHPSAPRPAPTASDGIAAERRALVALLRLGRKSAGSLPSAMAGPADGPMMGPIGAGRNPQLGAERHFIDHYRPGRVRWIGSSQPAQPISAQRSRPSTNRSPGLFTPPPAARVCTLCGVVGQVQGAAGRRGARCAAGLAVASRRVAWRGPPACPAGVSPHHIGRHARQPKPEYSSAGAPAAMLPPNRPPIGLPAT